MVKPRVIYWFRTDLRLHDSPALKAALDLDPEAFWGIWTWDPHYVYRTRVGLNRWQFLLDCQNDLSKSITQLNGRSKLFVIREGPQTLFPKLFKTWKVTHLVFEKDTDAYARDRDNAVIAAARDAGVEVIIRSGRTLFDSDLLVEKNHNKPTMSITQVQIAGPKVGPISRPIAAPKSLPDPGKTDLPFEQEHPNAEPDYNHESRKRDDQSYEKLSGPKGDFAVPTLEELGFPTITPKHRGGESIALEMLHKIIADEIYTATFEKPKTAPTAFEPQATTLLSPHLHFGSLSIREFYWRVQDVVDKHKGKASSPPVSLTGQLLFRDMYFGAQAALGHPFAQTTYNSHCRFIPWHLPSKVDQTTGRTTGEYHIDSPQAEEWFQRWKWGRTGFPWIDALMRQLRQEGWIHHLGRHAVACFLTRGGCWISWERGADVFEEWLIDHEQACNAGNWQWLSCTAFFAQFFRVYSPVAFPQKWDKEGAFVRRYVPELRDLPAKYIYEPWKAPVQDQRKAGVRIEGDGSAGAADSQVASAGVNVYPKPMFDFAERRTICLEGMKKAYAAGLFGDDPRVINGSWRELFPDIVASVSAEGKGSVISNSLSSKNGDASGKASGKKKTQAKIGATAAAAVVGNDDGGVEDEEEEGGGEAAETGGEGRGGDNGGGAAAAVKRGTKRAKRSSSSGGGGGVGNPNSVGSGNVNNKSSSRSSRSGGGGGKGQGTLDMHVVKRSKW